jgi:hypothetical protein
MYLFIHYSSYKAFNLFVGSYLIYKGFILNGRVIFDGVVYITIHYTKGV